MTWAKFFWAVWIDDKAMFLPYFVQVCTYSPNYFRHKYQCQKALPFADRFDVQEPDIDSIGSFVDKWSQYRLNVSLDFSVNFQSASMN